MAHGKLVKNQEIIRPGEGVRVFRVGKAESATGSEVAIDLSHAPVPEKAYTADVGAVVATPTGIRLIFGQTKSGSAELRSMIDVTFTTSAAKQFAASTTDVKASIERANVVKMQLAEMVNEPAQAVGMTANIAPIAFAGDDACIDFYNMSPFVAHAVKSGHDLFVQPVVRVMLPTGLLLALIERLEKHAADRPQANLVEA